MSQFREARRESFIRRANQVHGGAYGYELFVYQGFDKKGTILCPTHGPFDQTPGNHLAGSGCPDCALDRRRANGFKQQFRGDTKAYYRALKRRQAGMTGDRVMTASLLRSERETEAIEVFGLWYPNLESACRALEPLASSRTIKRWLGEGMSTEEAFQRVPNPGVANGTVYVVTHKATRKRYVGLTVQTPKRRLDFHCEQAARNCIKSMHSLHAAIRTEGIGAFKINRVDRGTAKKDLEAKERLWIAKLGTRAPEGYNLNAGGVSGGRSKVPTEIDGIRFAGRKEAAEHIARTRGISYQAAKKRLIEGRVDVRTPAPKGQSLVKTKAYKAWSQIKHGAINPKSKAYIPGLELYERWHAFDDFLADFGQPASPDLVFARFDKHRGYVPGNCGWMDRSTAARLSALNTTAARDAERRRGVKEPVDVDDNDSEAKDPDSDG